MCFLHGFVDNPIATTEKYTVVLIQMAERQRRFVKMLAKHMTNSAQCTVYDGKTEHR